MIDAEAMRLCWQSGQALLRKAVFGLVGGATRQRAGEGPAGLWNISRASDRLARFEGSQKMIRPNEGGI